VERYVREYLASHADAVRQRLDDWGCSADELVHTVVEGSEGNFMYLVHVLPDLVSGRLAFSLAEGAGGLPRGLLGYYQAHWTAMKSADEAEFTARQRPVLCFLAISEEPVTVAKLCEWTSLEPGPVKGVIKDWREFLNQSDATPPTFRIYHRSFAEFLDEEEDLRWYHDQIIGTALGKIPGFTSTT
jgi:hypothetical protein